jgi:hypothetical protein
VDLLKGILLFTERTPEKTGTKDGKMAARQEGAK